MTRTIKSLAILTLSLILMTWVIPGAAATLVSTQDEFRAAVKNAGPGDTIELANGTWEDFEILFFGEGTEKKPITLTAQDKGKVFLTGRSNLRLGGKHLVVSGLVFTDGYTPTREVIAFQINKDTLAHHSRVTEVVIDHFSNPERTETDYWVTMLGKNNRFDHNHLVGKSNNGVTMAVRLNTEDSIENHHRIDHNYFGPRPVLGSNGGETLRIGTSHYSLSNSFTVVEDNWFDRCNGEVEIISSKSGGNVFRRNVFFESRGTLTLRHGNDNLVEENIFLGNGVDHTGGIRVINKRQTVRNNYLEGLTGYRFGSALTIMNGVPDSPINRYHQVEDSVIESNTLINGEHIEMAAGSDDERSAVPLRTRFANNLIYNEDSSDVFSIHDDISGIEFSDNLLNEVADFSIPNGFTSTNLELTRRSNGLLYPEDEKYANVGVSADLKVLPKEQTGVNWYPKPEKSAVFDGGKVHAVTPGEDSLFTALSQSAPGDIIELAAGEYRVAKILQVGHPVTFRASSEGSAPLIEFERTAMFEIAQGGSLKLSGLHLSGKSAPDSAGNSLIRTSRYSMLGSYELLVENCAITDLDVNHSFNFLTASKSTFADRIRISHSSFDQVTGAVLDLNKEVEDLGLYNAEYIDIEHSIFTGIGKAVLDVYRGGTDESTFGPHVLISDSVFKDVGANKRNKSKASVFVHGVQVASIVNNEFVQSQPVKAELTVGDPITRISNNRFVATAAPVISNGEAQLEDNQFEEGEGQ